MSRRELECLQRLEHNGTMDNPRPPAVRDQVRSLLITGRTGPDLRGLAQRCGIS
jgi:hypothetical protein